MILPVTERWRKSSQHILPAMKPVATEGKYDIYPSFHAGDDLIFEGFDSLALALIDKRNVIIDGYVGVFFDDFRENLASILNKQGIKNSWVETSAFLKSPEEIGKMILPFLGGDDPLFGKYTNLELADFFETGKLKNLSPGSDEGINFIIGPGAALVGWDGFKIYLDLPKNEIQFRSRAGSITNLGSDAPSDPKLMYKRFYFVDWVVLNRHKESITPVIDLIVDAQRRENPVWMVGEELRRSLSEMSCSAFRVRPWFEPGTWGGSWIKDHISGLSENVPNYAWSFELIVPENGLLIESSGRLLEVSFDFLMYQEAEGVLGECYERFGTDFPIRFDFLDTFDGGNLSVQCHPRPEYMKEHFGGSFTQEETYYILDTKDEAEVYLGFQEDIDPFEFKDELEKSFRDSVPVKIEKYVQKHRASKHELFLIPYGTIHGSGKNNLVLEISSTPYIFTFKMYDWIRPDLDGNPRPLNIARGMANLFFDRKGSSGEEKLISKPVLLEKGEDWEMYHLPTHDTHLYDVHRYHFESEIEIHTLNKCHVLSLVEGSSVVVETSNGASHIFSYAETFVIPAAAMSYRIINRSEVKAIIIKAFVK